MKDRMMIALMWMSLTGWSLAQEPTKPSPSGQEEQPTSFWMQKKLEYSQTVLASLARGDLEQVVRSAEQLKTLGRIEGFVRKGVEGYPEQLRAFEYANRELARQARGGNLEGAVLAFNQMTVSCANCHKLLRESESK